MTALLSILFVAILWMSHRVYTVYVHTIGREERRHVLDSGRGTVPHRHLGPKFFLVLDFTLVVGIIWSLRQFGLFTRTEEAGLLEFMLRICLDSSVVLALWVVFEGRHLQSFYAQMAGVVRLRRRREGASDTSRHARVPRQVVLAVVTWAAFPALLDVVGVDLLGWAESRTEMLAIFATWFLVPQAVLGVLFARAVLPMRRLVYS